jgi:hypothetical protein
MILLASLFNPIFSCRVINLCTSVFMKVEFQSVEINRKTFILKQKIVKL